MKHSRAIHWFSIIVIALVFNVCSANGQGEANHWFTSRFHLDFNHFPVKVSPSEIPNDKNRYVSISDSKGNLLFVTDQEVVYDKDLKPMPNGSTGLDYHYGYGNGSTATIIPQPGSSLYYIFLPAENADLIDYVIIDLSKNGGLGDVVQTARHLPFSTHGTAATGNCDAFWVVTIQNKTQIGERKHLILGYKIDRFGLDVKPDTLNIKEFDTYFGLRFSPNGKKVVFRSDAGNNGSAIYNIVLCDFDSFTGKLSSPKKLLEFQGFCEYEFSPDNSKIYISVEDFIHEEFGLYQFNLNEEDSDEIEQSKIQLFEGSKELFIDGLALNPVGQILCRQGSSIGSGKTGIIKYPNNEGVECGFEINTFTFYLTGLLPNFVSTFLSPQFDESFDVSAGEDHEACTGETVTLGANPQPNTSYQWLPTARLSGSAIANPSFIHADTLGQKTDFQYVVEGKRGYCLGTDTVKVTIHPDKYAPISGSKSVCPRVTGVDYWAAADDRFRYDWSVTGGELVTGQHSDSIKVDWGKTNPAASVMLTPYNELNCPSDPITFPVRINVELQTETPVGEDLLCANLGSGIPYGITNTNGSVYTWESDAGNIISGQATNKVTIDWPGEGKYRLWVKEQSTTIDTVCYGISDSLLVDLFRDSTTIEVDYAQVMREDSGSLQVQWYVSDTARLAGEIEIYASSELSNQWDLIHKAGRDQVEYSYPDTIMNISPVSFHIASTNGCRERIGSDIHTTILLEGVADSARNAMTLSWTPYVGWSDNVDAYELWYRKDGDQYSRAATFLPNERRWSNSWGANGFEHDYRIRAIHTDGRTESWSNEVRLSFHHTLTIPNVFTPNGDGVNDTFNFPKLEIFHDNELLVLDRNGKEVFSRKDYDGSWDGNGVAPGVYYYSFTEKRFGTTYKGWLQILR